MNNPPARRALLALSHPLSITALLILLLNDHWWKKTSPSWVTGKLSDVSGLVFAPFVLLVLLAYVLPTRYRKHEHGLGLLALLIVGGMFALIKAVPVVRDGAARLFEAVFGWPIVIHIDPTDLLALPALLLAWHIWQRSATTTKTPRRSWSLLVLSTGALVATAPPWVDPGIFCLLPRNRQLIAPTESGLFISSDGGLTWHASAEEKFQRSECVYHHGQSWQISDPTDFGTYYRFQAAQPIERSADGGRTWQPDFLSPMTEAQSVYYSIVRQNKHAIESSITPAGPFDAAFDRATHHLVVAMGQEGVLVRTPNSKWQYVAVGLYSRIDLDRLSNLLPLLRWEMISAAILLFLIMATFINEVSRSWITFFQIAAWICWAGRLFVFPFGNFLFYNVDLAAWLGFMLPAVVAVPLGIISAARVLTISGRIFTQLLAWTFGSIVVFLIPYWLWSQGSIPQHQTATFFALGLAIVAALTGRQVIDISRAVSYAGTTIPATGKSPAE